ncbi:MAG: hypothetical protein HY924_16930 [Elusimicrobia bacterium]|nr:hypothetical protein [Elusimicrobiota bacterium]
MNTLTSAILKAGLLLACVPFRAAAGEGGLEPLQLSFRTHQVGQPYLDALAGSVQGVVCGADASSCEGLSRTLSRGRDVQEGCGLPCDSASEVAVYRAKISLVCEDLGLDRQACREAEANYIRDGVARKRVVADAKLDPGLRQAFSDKAQRLVRALGRSFEVSSETGSGSVVPARPAEAERGSRAPVPSAAAPPGAVKAQAAAPPAVLSDEEVDRRVSRDLGAQFSALIAQNPVGKAVADQAGRAPDITIERFDDGPHAQYDYGAKRVELNVALVAEVIERFGKVTVADPEDSGAVKRLMLAKPELFAVVARQLDSIYVHELTHAVQFDRSGTGLVGRALAWARQKVHGTKYPVEYELEASGNELAYFHAKVKADPSRLGPDKSRDEDISEYQEYLLDLQAYRRDRMKLYTEECQPVKDMRLYAWERRTLERNLAEQAKAWPKQSYEGSMLLAKRKASMTFPAPSLDFLGQAYARASTGGFLSSTRPEMKALLSQITARFESALDKAPAYSLAEGQRKLLKKLSSDLGVPLPPKIAKLVEKG